MQFCCGHGVYYKVNDMELVGLKWPHQNIGRPSGPEVLLRTWIATSSRNQSDQSSLPIQTLKRSVPSGNRRFDWTVWWPQHINGAKVTEGPQTYRAAATFVGRRQWGGPPFLLLTGES